MNLTELLAKQSQEEQVCRWQGNFAAYVELVKQHPEVVRPAHTRVYDMIHAQGWVEHEGVRSYRFFTDHLYGIEPALQHLVEGYFLPAAKRLDVRHRILLLVGPVGSGKSTIATLLKQGMEAYSRTPQGAVYGLQGCPLHEEPLHLIPIGLRPQLQATLGVRIEGQLCPVCQQRLASEFNSQPTLFPVERVVLSEACRVGIGTFQPRDPGNQDIAELTGSIDLSTITRYGVESDPRAFRFDGELCVANRGVLEMQELLKCDERFLWHLLSLTQEGSFKVGRYALISADEVVIAHCNEDDYRTFVAHKRNEALLSRMLVLPIPYALSVDAEVRAYEKLIGESDLTKKHLAPGTLEVAAKFSVLSRQTADKEPKGMQGVDPRFVTNRVCAALIADHCIGPWLVLRSIQNGVEANLAWSTKVKEHLLELIQCVRRDFTNQCRNTVETALCTCWFPQVAEIVVRYLQQVSLYTSENHQLQPGAVLPDETFMRQIEQNLGIGESGKRVFRNEVTRGVNCNALTSTELNALVTGPLGTAVARHLLELAQPNFMFTPTESHLATQPNSRGLLHSQLTDTLVEQHGYCRFCAQQLLDYVSSLQSC